MVIAAAPGGLLGTQICNSSVPELASRTTCALACKMKSHVQPSRCRQVRGPASCLFAAIIRAWTLTRPGLRVQLGSLELTRLYCGVFPAEQQPPWKGRLRLFPLIYTVCQVRAPR